MSGCRFEAIEAWVYGELDGAAESEARAHVASCAECAEEAEMLRAERGLFAERSRLEAPPPGLAAVMARSRWGVDPTPRAPVSRAPSLLRRVPWAALGVAAAAAMACVFTLPADPERPSEPAAAQIIRAEPVACFDDEPGFCDAPAINWTVAPQSNRGIAPPRDVDLTTAAIEAEYGACMISTPADDHTCAVESRSP